MRRLPTRAHARADIENAARGASQRRAPGTLPSPAHPLRLEAHEYGDHPRTIIEIATDVKFRDAHDLRDGDSVELEIDEADMG